MADNLFNLNNPKFWGIMVQFLMNLFCLYLLIRVVYFKYSKKKNFVFSFFLLGIMIFFLGSMLKLVYIEMGFGFTLFAIFTILRFRTSSFSIKDMAYMLTTVAVSLINSLSFAGFPLLGIFIFNVIIIISAIILEESLIITTPDSNTIVYDDLELLKPINKQSLLKDISERSGREILKIRIRRINYKRNVAVLEIFFND